MKLLIRNLDRNTEEPAIKNLFETYGVVQSCNLVMDKNTGQSKGFGFVEMPNLTEAKAALQKLNGFKLDANKIRVKKAETKPADETPE